MEIAQYFVDWRWFDLKLCFAGFYTRNIDEVIDEIEHALAALLNQSAMGSGVSAVSGTGTSRGSNSMRAAATDGATN